MIPMNSRLTLETFNKALTILAHRDPDLGAVIAKFGKPPVWRRPRGFETLVLLILEQQVSLASARAAYDLLAIAAGELAPEALTLQDASWYADNDVTLILGDRVTAIDRERRLLITHRGNTLRYDRLVLATGSRPALPAVPGITLDGVHTFRDLRDVSALEAIARQGGNAVVIGGGLLGLEAAEGLRKRGGRALTVSVLQRSHRLMNRQLDTTAAQLLEATLRERGILIETCR